MTKAIMPMKIGRQPFHSQPNARQRLLTGAGHPYRKSRKGKSKLGTIMSPNSATIPTNTGRRMYQPPVIKANRPARAKLAANQTSKIRFSIVSVTLCAPNETVEKHKYDRTYYTQSRDFNFQLGNNPNRQFDHCLAHLNAIRSSQLANP